MRPACACARFLLAMFCVAACGDEGSAPCPTTEIGRPAEPDELAAAVDCAASEGFSGAVAIVRDGMPSWAGGVGFADRERMIANAPQIAFDCGSIMKVVTAAAIFRLEADGALSRSATLGELLPDVPPDKAAITLDLVLAHRAGFDEFHDTEGDFEEMDRETALARILAQELLFEPDSDESYSNSGYTLLAIVVEQASGLPFGGFIRTRLFDAADMAATGLYGDGLWADGEAAIGYDDGTFGCNSPGCWPAPTWALVGNGGLVSTADDLLRWSAAIDGGAIFDGAARDAYRDAVLVQPGLSIGGASLLAASGRNDFGFGAVVAEVPSRETIVTVTANAAASHDTDELAARLLQMTLGESIEIQRD
jgi:CubicO group peptidase (beta-lactamase class C family)